MNSSIIRSIFFFDKFFRKDLDLYLHYGSTVKAFWLKDNEILIKKAHGGICAIVLSPVGPEEIANVDNLKQQHEIKGTRKIGHFLQLCSLLTGINTTPPVSETDIITSISDAENIPTLDIEVNYSGYSHTAPSEHEIAEVSVHLRVFLERMKVLYSNYEPILDKHNFLRLSLWHYGWAKYELLDPLHQLVHSITSLESLFKKSKEKSSCSKTRCSVILDLVNIEILSRFNELLNEKENIMDDLDRCYKVRNDFLHGEPSGEQKNVSLSRLLRYNRLSIICSLIISYRNPALANKQQFLSLMDDSTRRDLLENQINEQFKEFRSEVSTT